MSEKAKSCCPLEAVSNVKSSCKSSQCNIQTGFLWCANDIDDDVNDKKRGAELQPSVALSLEKGGVTDRTHQDNDLHHQAVNDNLANSLPHHD